MEKGNRPSGGIFPEEEEMEDHSRFFEDLMASLRKPEKHVFLEVVLDGTYSFSKVFLPVWRALKTCMDNIEKLKMQYEKVTVEYGLIIIREMPEEVCFRRSGRYLTEDVQELLDEIRGISFFGGGRDGRENINAAVQAGFLRLKVCGRTGDVRALLLLTDSLPADTLSPVFYPMENSTPGLDFVVCYTGGREYHPDFTVDEDGNPTFHPVVQCMSIEEVLAPQEGKTMQQIVVSRMRQVLNNTAGRRMFYEEDAE